MIKFYYIDITNKENIDINEVPKNARDLVCIYRDENAKKIRGYSWFFLNDILKKDYGINLEEKMITFNEYGKPYIEGIYFNISHSENMIAIVVSDNEVGIDIEAVNNLKKHLDSKYYLEWLNEDEINEFNKTEDKLKFLTKAWTKKEAILKLKGIGIQKYTELKTVNGNVRVYEIKKSQYILSIAVEEKK